jgi:hypothetical protein
MVLKGGYFTIGLWFDQPIFPSVLLAVGDALVTAGGRYDGDVTVVPSGAAFAGGFDTDVYRTLDRHVVEGSAPGTVEGTVYRIDLCLPVVGEAEVRFARTSRKVPADEHPVEINMEADLVGFSYDHLDRKDRTRIKAKERAFLRQMQALCKTRNWVLESTSSGARRAGNSKGMLVGSEQGGLDSDRAGSTTPARAASEARSAVVLVRPVSWLRDRVCAGDVLLVRE